MTKLEQLEHDAEAVLATAPALLAEPVASSFEKAQPEQATSSGTTTQTGTVNSNVARTLTQESGNISKAADVEANKEHDPEAAKPEPNSQLLTGYKLALCFGGMLLSIFLVALDQTIQAEDEVTVSPALPVIASKFEALEQIAWIASAYFLTQCAFLLLYGQALTVFDRRMTYMTSIILFEIGSLLCAVAVNVNMLIFARAFAGTGAAGIFTSVLSILADVTTLEQRPQLLGFFGAVFSVSSVVGPLLGGAFTDHVSWRWCFYINLPIGALTVIAILLILKPSPPQPLDQETIEYTQRKFQRYFRGRLNPAPGSFLFKVGVLDLTGAVIMLATITFLVLPLQWGGNQYPWSDPKVIGFFCGFGALVVIFIIYEWKFAGKTGLLPLRLFKDRTQIGASVEAFALMFAFLLALYYLPIFYEATRGTSASKAGIQILPFMIAVTFTAGVAGGLVTKFGRYWHLLTFGPLLIPVASGLFFTINAHTSTAKLIGYQILLAIGLGSCLQSTIIAVQCDCKDPRDIPQKTAGVTFLQLVGGTIGLAIANTMFSNRLGSALAKYAPNAPAIVRSSVEAVKDVAADLKPGVQQAYAEALSFVFIIGIPIGIIAALAGGLTRNISVKGKDIAAGGA